MYIKLSNALKEERLGNAEKCSSTLVITLKFKTCVTVRVSNFEILNGNIVSLGTPAVFTGSRILFGNSDLGDTNVFLQDFP